MGVADLYSPELAAQLCALSFELRRQLGVLLDRRGRPEFVVIGDARRLWLPDIGRFRAARGRLRGLRLVHTHLQGEGITDDDLTDLALLRLDMVVALTLTHDGAPGLCHVAHLLPPGSGAPWRTLEPCLAHDVRIDLRELIRALEEEQARASQAQTLGAARERAVLIHVSARDSKRTEQACLTELRELCCTAGVTVVETVIQRRDRAAARLGIGRGKLDEVVLKANQLSAELLIFDPDLTATQARAISEATDLKVIDRTMLILDIFAQRATSRDGKLQVELAQLRYSLPRLIEKNTMMSRLTGGIGGRGPGETKLEINRRRARERIQTLEKQVNLLVAQRQRRRALRQRRDVPVVSIIGYTNAGKSTLLNTLTESATATEDALFATLDPISRRLRFPQERELIVTDTVGFIHDLPADLVQAFRATLEELADADLFIHVVDIADEAFAEKMEAVQGIITDLGVAETPTILALNKVDRLAAEDIAARTGQIAGISLSARDAESTRPLLRAMERALWMHAGP